MNMVSLLGTASTVLVGGYIFRKTIFSTIEPILFNIYKFNRNYIHPTLIKFRDYDICYRFRLLTAVISGKNINERLTNQNKYQQNGTTIQSIPKHISNNGYMINKSGFYKLIAILNDDFKDIPNHKSFFKTPKPVNTRPSAFQNIACNKTSDGQSEVLFWVKNMDVTRDLVSTRARIGIWM